MKVRAIESNDSGLTEGRVYEVSHQHRDSYGTYYRLVADDQERHGYQPSWKTDRFEVVADDEALSPGGGGRAAEPMILPTDPNVRKGIPITTGVLDYFPLALAEVAIVSKAGNDQHNPGQPLHWAKGKSTDHADTIPRHLIDRGRRDTDGMRHSAKLAWRALALLQTELENEAKA